MKVRALRKVEARQIMVFRIRNRKGYAAICLGNLTEGRSPAQAVSRLTEGRSPAQAVSRLKHPLRRMGYALPAQFARPA